MPEAHGQRSEKNCDLGTDVHPVAPYDGQPMDVRLPSRLWVMGVVSCSAAAAERNVGRGA